MLHVDIDYTEVRQTHKVETTPRNVTIVTYIGVGCTVRDIESYLAALRDDLIQEVHEVMKIKQKYNAEITNPTVLATNLDHSGCARWYTVMDAEQRDEFKKERAEHHTVEPENTEPVLLYTYIEPCGCTSILRRTPVGECQTADVWDEL